MFSPNGLNGLIVHALPLNFPAATGCITCNEPFLVVAVGGAIGGGTDTSDYVNTAPYLPCYRVDSTADNADYPIAQPGVSPAGFAGLPYTELVKAGSVVWFAFLYNTSKVVFVATRSVMTPNYTLTPL